MKIQEIQEHIKNVSEVGTDLDKEAANTHRIHGRLLAMKSDETLILRSLELELSRVMKERWLFYTGKASPQAYKDENFDLKILRGEVGMFLDADDKIQAIRSKMAVQKSKVEMLDEALKGCNQRVWSIRAMLDYQKLSQGTL